MLSYLTFAEKLEYSFKTVQCPATPTVTLHRKDDLFQPRRRRGAPLIADCRLRISDLELMNGFSIRTNRNPQFNRFSVHLRVLRVSVVNKDQRGIRWTFGALTSATTRSPGWSANSSHACLVSKADSRKPQSRPIRIIGPSLVTERTVAGR